MSPEALFGYLAAFITIILALALTDMIQSLQRLIRGRDRVRFAALPLIAAAWVYLGVLSAFFSLWSALQLQEVTYLMLVWQTINPTLLALLAFAALPDEVPADGIDLSRYYEENRRYLATLIALTFAADLAGNIARNIGHTGNYSAIQVAVAWSAYGLTFAMCALLWSGPARWRQYAGWAGLFLAASLGYLSWVARAR